MNALAEDNTPVPCRRCGAPMVEEPVAHAHAPVIVRCDYCQVREELPADAARRVQLLRQRLQEMRWAQAALEGPALAIARLAESYPKMVAPGVVMMGVVACISSGQMLSHALSLPTAVGAARTTVLLSALIAPVQIGFVILSVIGGAVLALRQYAAELRPALEARPPLHEGNVYRCRSCGGPIDTHAKHGAFVTCGYCNAPNVLGATTAAHRAKQLEREIEEYRARAHGERPRIAQAADRYKRRIQVTSGVVVALNVVFVFAISAVQRYLALHG